MIFIMKLASTLSALLLVAASASAREFVHPGLSYTDRDIERMQQLIADGAEPYSATFEALKNSKYSTVGAEITPITSIPEGRFNATVGEDGRRVHDLALMYRLTGDRAYADEAVKRLNRYNGLTNCSARGTGPLDNGKVYLMIEGAELLRDYDGWAEADRRAFADMLVHPGYSDTEFPSGSYNLDDAKNDVTFYWNIYQFDQGRWGNQGLFAARAMMAMGIFLDNEKIYDRALRYLRSMDAREDDIPYPCQTPVSGSENNAADTNRTHISYNGSWKPSDRQFISDEALQHYIYANGQCQETCRDQGHAMVGVGLYTDLAEMAASQGDDLYGDLDCRILLGLEYSIRYNMTYDWPEPWEPSGYSKTEADCTFDNGVFYQAKSRSPRWEAVKPYADDRYKAFSCVRYLSQALAHYKHRGKDSRSEALDPSRYEWLQKAVDQYIGDGIEDWGASGHQYEWKGWGTLTKRIPEKSDSGTTSIGTVEPDKASAPEYYNVAGYKVDGDNLKTGLYIERRGNDSNLILKVE